MLKIKVIPNAPYFVEGEVELILVDGSTVLKKNPHLCRCGASKNKPLCDGTHVKVDFRD